MGLDFRDPTWASFDLREWLPQFSALGAEFPSESDTVIVRPPPGTPSPPSPIPGGYIDPDVALAIMAIEAGAAGFDLGGRLIIRFEAHIFRQRLADEVRFLRHFTVADTRPWSNPQFYRENAGDPERLIHSGQQNDEWAALRIAMNLDPAAALESTSMGIAQIMGFNHARVGYRDVRAMFADYQDSEAAQIVGFYNYILTDPALLKAVREKDWRAIALLYNGAGAVDTYSRRLEDAYNRRVAA